MLVRLRVLQFVAIIVIMATVWLIGRYGRFYWVFAVAQTPQSANKRFDRPISLDIGTTGLADLIENP